MTEGQPRSIDYSQFWVRHRLPNHTVRSVTFKASLFKEMFGTDAESAMGNFMHYGHIEGRKLTSEQRERLEIAISTLNRKQIDPKKVMVASKKAKIVDL